MMPGDLISEGNLAKLVAVSRTPLRQALQQLQHGGFIKSIPKIGWQVAPLDFDKLDELYDFRILIELNAIKSICDSNRNEQILKDLLIKSDKKDLTILNESIKYISDKDVAVIGKDFGELSGAWWFLNNYDSKLSFVEFPSRSNEPLVDYYVGYPNGIKLKVSAKADKGAAPALNAIWDTIKDKTFTGTDKQVHTFISTIVNNNGLESIILASKHFGSTAYTEVGNVIGKKTYTSDDIEAWLKTYKDGKVLFNVLNQKLFSKIGRTVPAENIHKILSEAGARRCGIILSPMAYSLVDEVNANKSYKGFLTQACKAMSVEQLYVNIKSNSQTLNYKLKGFKNSDFVFEYHSNAGNPGGNKIGFKMEL
jgi:hypothetical protein